MELNRPPLVAEKKGLNLQSNEKCLNINEFKYNNEYECSTADTSRQWPAPRYAAGNVLVKRENRLIPICIVRYCEAFMVIASSENWLKYSIKPAIIKFLKDRQLGLDEKTSILSVRKSHKIHFLAYTFQYIAKFKAKYKLYPTRIGKSGIACYTQKEEFNAFRKKMKGIISKSFNLSGYELIEKLNPLIISWCTYFNFKQAIHFNKKLSGYLYRCLWNWAQRKHPR